MGLTYSNAMGNAPYYAVISGTLDTMNSLKSPLDLSSDIQSPGSKHVDNLLSGQVSAGNGSFTSSEVANTYHLSKDVLGAYTSGIGSLADANA